MSKYTLVKCDRYNCYNKVELPMFKTAMPGWSMLEIRESGTGKQEGEILHNQCWLCPTCTEALNNSVGIHPYR